MKSIAKQAPSTSPANATYIKDSRGRNSTNVKLLELTTAKFNGNLRNWGSFSDQFVLIIRFNATLSRVNKFRYVRGYLIRKAAVIIKGLSASFKNHCIATDLPKGRFGKTVIQGHTTTLLNLPRVFMSVKLSNSVSFTTRCRHASAA